MYVLISNYKMIMPASAGETPSLLYILIMIFRKFN